MTIYDFSVTAADGNKVSLTEYKGKVLLIVNTATECGFTSQYDDLQVLYNQHKADGLEILDFPCNQFGNQAPDTVDHISAFCSANFGTTFPRFEKIEVEGPNAEPLYTYLIGQKGFEGFDEGHEIGVQLEAMLQQHRPNYKDEPNIKWNFTKFLVNRKGEVVARFEPTANFAVIDHRVEQLLQE